MPAVNDGGMHVMGNGRLCVYGRGLDLPQIFGPQYSAPTALGVRVPVEPDWIIRAERVPGTAVWRHTIGAAGSEAARIEDFVDYEHPFFVRRMELAQPLTLMLDFDKLSTQTENTRRFESRGIALALNIYQPRGSVIYTQYLSHAPYYHQLLLMGKTEEVVRVDATHMQVRLAPGLARLVFVAGTTYPDCIEQTEAVLKLDLAARREQTVQSWQKFTQPVRERVGALVARAGEGALGRTPPRRLEEAIEGIAVLIKAQQGRDGAVLAGHNYHLGYIRDQYGVMRCLLKLGCRDEARAITMRLLGIWKKMGRLYNAHGIDVDGIQHIHECDDVEITGYVVEEAFDYYELTGDEQFLRDVFPMLEWCWEAQCRHLAGGMLPFNGDETYIAGGVLPRTCLNDGSAEATMLFITSGTKLLDWIERQKLWNAEKIRNNHRILADTRARYLDNFLVEGRLATNNPARTGLTEPPRFRHGVCEAVMQPVTWTERTPNGRYVCPKHFLDDPPLPAAEPKQYFLRSVGLQPLYFGSDLVPRELLVRDVNEVASRFLETGKLPSSPDGSTTIGYDYGLLLYSMARIGHPDAGQVLDRMMGVLDSTGAWVEYYRDGAPQGCRCRPWESGINVDAILEYLAVCAAARGR
ncbi:MAG: hypothetical protein M1457_09815 [bacterium]|nr:hypothetical protein [bacterium]